MNGYSKHFHKNNKSMNVLVNDKKNWKNILKYATKLKIYLKKNLMVNQCLVINILKLK